MSNNPLLTLQFVEFNQMINLRELYLSFIHISTLPDRIFWSNYNLQILDLSQNELTHFNYNKIINHTKINKLNVSNNKITHFYINLNNKSDIDLYGNPLTCKKLNNINRNISVLVQLKATCIQVNDPFTSISELKIQLMILIHMVIYLVFVLCFCLIVIYISKQKHIK